MYCRTGFCKMQSPLLSAALINRLTASNCVTATTPMNICSLYGCAVTQHQCTAALVLAKCNHPCTVLQDWALMMQRGFPQAAHCCSPYFPFYSVVSLQSARCLPSSFPLHLRLSYLCGKTAVHEAHTSPTQDVQTHHCCMHGQQLKKHARQACDLIPSCVTFAWQQLDDCSASW